MFNVLKVSFLTSNEIYIYRRNIYFLNDIHLFGASKLFVFPYSDFSIT